MLVLVIRTLILYAVVVLSIRIMGKRQIGEMQPSELVVAIMISDLASVPMQSIEIPLLAGIIPVLTLLVGEVTMSFISLKSKRARRYITGEPSILVYKGHINEGELERLRFNLNDLMEQLRLSGCPNPCDVQVAVLETNGQLSVMEKGKNDFSELPYIFIADGDVNESELARAGKTRSWLTEKVGNDVKNIFIAISTDGRTLHIQKKGEKDR
ncbi:MAG: DUF421 domain-containing protein [Ruminococcaceae bacterium]|nr:DUF421 domain-containing protein [Oscillospiraceae bacterium]